MCVCVCVYVCVTGPSSFAADKIGDACAEDRDCVSVIPHANCTDLLCFCDSGFFPTNSDTECQLREFLSANRNAALYAGTKGTVGDLSPRFNEANGSEI